MKHTYEFGSELRALEAADRRSREICEEAERVRQRQLQQQQELGLNVQTQQPSSSSSSSSSSSLLRQHVPEIPSTQFANSLSVITSHAPPAATSLAPSPVLPAPPPPPPPPPPPGGITSFSHPPVILASSVNPPPSSSSSMSSFHSLPVSSSTGTSLPPLLPPNRLPALAGSSYGALGSQSSPAVMPVLASAAPVMSNGSSSSMQALPPSSLASGSSDQALKDPVMQPQQQPQPALKLKPINTREFEDFVGSSPFDDALLRSIDDKQELNSVFANVHPSSSIPSQSHSGHHHPSYHGPNHSAYNTFSPR